MAEKLTGREVHLASRPTGEPTAENFRVETRDVPEPADGQVVVRNSWMSVDPYMRGRMNDARSYVPPFQVDEVMGGAAVGEVVASNAPGLAAGDTVYSELGWREYAVDNAAAFRKVDATAVPITAYLSVLGLTGLTAYAGLFDVAHMKEGDAVFVSGAAGSVGGLAGQFARLKGASRVVGSAGSDQKVRHVIDDLGFDDAFNYRSGAVRDGLRRVAPDGIDVYFDNVGGEHLEAAIGALKLRGRVALCGAISGYNTTEPPPGPRNLALAIGKRLTLRGFIAFDHNHLFPELFNDVSAWVSECKLHLPGTVFKSIEKAPDAFIALLRGENTGKMLVKLS